MAGIQPRRGRPYRKATLTPLPKASNPMASKTARSGRGHRGSRKSTAGVAGTAKAVDLRLLAREAALAALQRLADLSRSEDERIALAATQELLNRAFGKAVAAGTEDAPGAQPLIVRIVRFGEPERDKGGGES